VKALAAHLTEHLVSFSLRRGRIRLSPHFYIQPAEVDRVVALVRDFSGR
jgi:selenocysteine lyase/cysteine desulfurase